ncbi:MAG: Spy/CpxP family protein refolding chaperone [Sulfurovaceae bacterium]|nr:Spy/CpxP family protein refolding chaperone [Sulfurovaceae bacterium]
MKIILAFLLFLGIALADDDHHYYKKDLTFLQLTDEQKEPVKQILKNYREQVREYKVYEHDLLKQKQSVFLSKNFDASKIERINKNLELKASIIEIDLLSSIHKILNNEQRKKFANYIDEWEIE